MRPQLNLVGNSLMWRHRETDRLLNRNILPYTELVSEYFGQEVKSMCVLFVIICLGHLF